MEIHEYIAGHHRLDRAGLDCLAQEIQINLNRSDSFNLANLQVSQTRATLAHGAFKGFIEIEEGQFISRREYLTESLATMGIYITDTLKNFQKHR